MPNALPEIRTPGGIWRRLYSDRSIRPTTLVAAGFDPEAVVRVVGLIDRAEYKRRQMPPGVRISGKAFGKDRRMPITNRYRPVLSHPAGPPPTEQTATLA